MGWGGDDTTHVSCFATGSSFEHHATLHDLSLVLMLHYMIFPWFSSYATGSSFELHAMLHDLSLVLNAFELMRRADARCHCHNLYETC